MKRVIRLGDTTTHGGVVVGASGIYIVMGMQIARVGDRCTCPRKGHSNCVITQGDPAWIVNGRAVALEGHLTSCGAALVSTLPSMLRGA